METPFFEFIMQTTTKSMDRFTAALHVSRADAAFIGIFLISAAVYWPGLAGGFIFDDLDNIVNNKLLQVKVMDWEGLRQVFFSGFAGPLGRPISMLSFWVNYYLTDLDPFYFKLTNLIIHLLTGCLIFQLAKKILRVYRAHHRHDLAEARIQWIAAISAGLWLLHPINLTAVLYIVQRMTSLAALFTVAGLIFYLHGREKLTASGTGLLWIVVGAFGCGGLAIAAKENGALLPLYMLVLETTLFRFSTYSKKANLKIKLFFIATVALPVLIFILFIYFNPNWLTSAYIYRNFSLLERLMSETRILWLYLRWIVIPDPTQLNLFHDDILISRGLLNPPSTIIAMAGLVAVSVGAFMTRKKAPLFAFAVFWFLAGHSMESSVFPLELAFEHRNYLPMFGPILGLTYGISSYLPAQLKAFQIRPIIAFLTIWMTGTVILLRVDEWRDTRKLTLIAADHSPNSARANYEAGVILATLILRDQKLSLDLYDTAEKYFLRSIKADQNSINGLFSMILLQQSTKKKLSSEIIAELQHRLSESHFTMTIIKPFEKLVDWIIAGAVSLPESTVVSLFEAVLGNPNVPDYAKGILLSHLSAYYFYLNNPQTAASLALAAVEQSPNQPILHLSLADLAIKLGNHSLASKHLMIADQLDKTRVFQPQIKQLNEELAMHGTVAPSLQSTPYHFF